MEAAVPALVGVFLSLAIISFGHWAWRRLRRRPEESAQTNTRIPLVVKAPVWIGGIGLWLYFMTVLSRPTDKSDRESTAIGLLRAINSGQASYSSSCAAGGYAVDLADLAKAPTGSTQGFVNPDLNTKTGVVYGKWTVTLARDGAPGVTDVSSAAETCNKSTHQPVSSYFAGANPVKPEPGRRYFATDTRGTIFVSTSGPVPNPIPPNTAVVQ